MYLATDTDLEEMLFMHRIRTRTAALVSSVALAATVAAAPLAAQADKPEKDPCAKREAQVEKAEAALAHVTAVFAQQQAKVDDATDAVEHADNRSERAAARAELHQARADKAETATVKKAQQMRLAKATQRLTDCETANSSTTAA